MNPNLTKQNIPSGWRRVKLGEICALELGIKAKEGELNYLEIGDIDIDQKNYSLSYKTKTTMKGAVKVPKETLLISRVRPTRGAITVTKSEINVSPAFTRIKLHNRYLYFIVTQDKFFEYLGSKATGSTYPTCKDEDVLNFEFLYTPKTSEQQKIAEILGTVDEGIAKTQEVINETEKLKRGLMQQLFTRGIGNTEFKTLKLGNLCIFQTGKLNSNRAVSGGEYPFFTCSQETFAIDQYSFDQKAILLAGNNAAGKYSVKYYEGKFDAYQRTYVISIKDEDELSYPYLKEVLNTRLNELRDSSVGSTTKFLTLKLLENLPISLPSIRQQREIAEILSTINEKISINKKLKEKLTLLKKGLMQDLLSGRVRVLL